MRAATGTRLAIRALLTLLAVIVLGGCSLVESPDPARPTSTPVPSGRPLPAKWYVDTDRNTIPDFIERNEDFDPARDDCLPDRCQDKDRAAVDQLLDQGQNTLLVLDSSGSMAGPAGAGETKIEAAKDAIATYARAAPPDIDHLGFAVYGHRGGRTEANKAESCRGVDILAGIDEFGARSARRVLARFDPLGFTPVAGALRRSREAFRGREGELNRVVLVSDGVETCGGDPVAAARALRESGIRVTVDVVGFDIQDEGEVDRLREVAEAGGGEYVDAKTGDALRGYFGDLLDERRALGDALVCGNVGTRQALMCNGVLHNQSVEYINIEQQELVFVIAREQRRLPPGDPRRTRLPRDDPRMRETERIRQAVGAAGQRRQRELLARNDERVNRIRDQLERIERLGRRLERRG